MNIKIASIIIIILIFLGLGYLLFGPQAADKVQAPQRPIDEIIDKNTNMNNETNNLASGLKIEILNEGEGSVAENGKIVMVHYTGTLEDGTKFDSSLDRGQPFPFVLGEGRVIRGWEEGVLGMKVGEKRKLTIPSDLAYGPAGIKTPDGTVIIPENATLIFEVELLSVE